MPHQRLSDLQGVLLTQIGGWFNAASGHLLPDRIVLGAVRTIGDGRYQPLDPSTPAGWRIFILSLAPLQGR